MAAEVLRVQYLKMPSSILAAYSASFTDLGPAKAKKLIPCTLKFNPGNLRTASNYMPSAISLSIVAPLTRSNDGVIKTGSRAIGVAAF